MADWVEAFFAGPYRELYAPLLGPEITARQVDAAWHWLDLASGARLLDLGCGHGRHAVALAGRGLRVVGQDLDPASLQAAEAAAMTAGVVVDWRHGDMRQIAETDGFEAVLSLFSTFGYFAEDDDNVAVLKAVARALAPGGRFLLDVDNRDAALAAGAEQRVWEPQADGRTLLEERRYDPLSGRMHIRLGWWEAGAPQMADQWLRLYTLPELVHLLRTAGLAVTGAWGDYDGRPYDLQAPRLILRAVKPDL